MPQKETKAKVKGESLGKSLRIAREKKRLSLDDVYAKTRIHTRILEALEQDRGDQALGGIYIKSFIKRYSDFLGLDNDELIRKVFSCNVAAQSEPNNNADGTFKEKISFDYKKYILPVIVAVSIFFLILLSGFAGAKLVRGVKNFLNRPPKIISAALPLEKSKDKSHPIPESEELVLEVNTIKDVWIEVKADGKRIFRRIVPKQTHESWNANKSLELWLGKAEAVKLTLNGRALNSPGKGVVKNIVITREGMKVGK